MRVWTLGVAVAVSAANLTGQTACLEPVGAVGIPPQHAGLIVADVNGDGRDDVVTSGTLVKEIAIRFGQAGGALSAPLTIAVDRPVSNPHCLAAGDLDGDGDVDLVLGHDRLLTVLHQGPANVFTATEYDLGIYSFLGGIQLGDLDGDGDLDAAVLDASIDKIRVFSNDGAGAFTDFIGGDSSVWPSDMRLGDIDGDGDLDAWMTGVGDFGGPPPQFRLALNDGAGVFTTALTLSFQTPVSLDVGDVDGDGDLDLVLVARDSGVLRVYLNNAGAFAAPLVRNLADNQQDVALADLDQDGDLDMVTTFDEGLIVVWNNALTFTTAPRVDLLTSRRVAAGDFNGDGVADLAAVSGPTSALQLSAFRGGCSGILGSFCSGDGSGAACPCGAVGAPGAGCPTSLGAGAVLSASGSASLLANDLAFQGSALLPGQSAVLFVGDSALNGGAGVPFGDGLRCAGGSLRRLGLQLPDAFGNASWGPGLAAQGGWSAGDLRRFQVGFRDPANACGNSFNLTQGVEVRFGP
jgi:hypothetical protein